MRKRKLRKRLSPLEFLVGLSMSIYDIVTTKLEKYQKKKLYYEQLLSLLLIIIGIIMVVYNIATTSATKAPIFMWIGIFIAVSGVCFFSDVRDKKSSKSSKRTRK